MINWIDTETTGLRVKDGARLIQIALIITDDELAEKERKEFLVFHNEDAKKKFLEESTEEVIELHYKTGLWNTLQYGESLEKIDEYLSEMIISNGSKGGILGGNSVGFDRQFIDEFLPKTSDVLGYQYYDVSSIRKHYDSIGIPHFGKRLKHRAMDDIEESLNEARYYMQILKAFDELTGGGE